MRQLKKQLQRLRQAFPNESVQIQAEVWDFSSGKTKTIFSAWVGTVGDLGRGDTPKQAVDNVMESVDENI